MDHKLTVRVIIVTVSFLMVSNRGNEFDRNHFIGVQFGKTETR